MQQDRRLLAGAALLQIARPIQIGRGAQTQALLKGIAKLGIAFEVEGARQAHHGRGVDLGVGGNLAHGLQRHVVGTLQDMMRGALQLGTEAREHIGDLPRKVVEIHRSRSFRDP